VKLSEYAIRLREKQKVRRVYGVLESQFHGYFQEASRRKGRTGEEMLALLERRLDNVVHRLGFAASRAEARQLVRHGHVHVNGKRLDIPSFIVRVGDRVTLTEGARKFKFVAAAVAGADKRPIASWLDADRAGFTGSVKGTPVREDLNEPEIREQLVVEYYSR
jgi:small subunit ribosomal protein S4